MGEQGHPHLQSVNKPMAIRKRKLPIMKRPPVSLPTIPTMKALPKEALLVKNAYCYAKRKRPDYRKNNNKQLSIKTRPASMEDNLEAEGSVTDGDGSGASSGARLTRSGRRKGLGKLDAVVDKLQDTKSEDE